MCVTQATQKACRTCRATPSPGAASRQGASSRTSMSTCSATAGSSSRRRLPCLRCRPASITIVAVSDRLCTLFCSEVMGNTRNSLCCMYRNKGLQADIARAGWGVRTRNRAAHRFANGCAPRRPTCEASVRPMAHPTGEYARRPVAGLPRAPRTRPRYGAVDRGRSPAKATAAQQWHLEPALLLVTWARTETLDPGN